MLHEPGQEYLPFHPFGSSKETSASERHSPTSDGICGAGAGAGAGTGVGAAGAVLPQPAATTALARTAAATEARNIIQNPGSARLQREYLGKAVEVGRPNRALTAATLGSCGGI